MRRFILIFLMLLLPVQWSWAAAASVCAHEKDNSHFGHHEHQHSASPQAAEPDEADEKAPSFHPDCQVCHGIGTACVTSPAEVGAAWSSAGPPSAYGRYIPEPPIESLLRPPLTLVA
jgi:hypothetical protein